MIYVANPLKFGMIKPIENIISYYLERLNLVIENVDDSKLGKVNSYIPIDNRSNKCYNV